MNELLKMRLGNRLGSDGMKQNLPFYGSQEMVDPKDMTKRQPFMPSGEPFTEDMLQKLNKLANPEISMAPFGSTDTSADVQAMRDLTRYPRELLNQLDVGQNKGAISNREMDMFGPSATKSLDDELKARGLYDPAMTTEMKRNNLEIAKAMDMIGQTKGAISNAEMQVLEQAQMESGETFTSEEKEMALKKIRELSQKSQAPLFEQAEQLRIEGEGDDTEIGHLKPGEVIIDPVMLEDPQFENVVQRKFDEFGIPIEIATVGGLNSINPVTGVAQFGFLKKVGKFLKKVVAPVAKVAQFVPGPWQIPAALISKADTVRNVVRGDANPLALLTVAGPGAIGGTLSENLAGLKAAGDGSFLKGLGSLGGKTVGSIGKAIMNPIDAIKGIPSLIGSASVSGQPKVGVNTPADAMLDYQNALKSNPALANMAPLSAVDPSFLSAKEGIMAGIKKFDSLMSQAELDGDPALVNELSKGRYALQDQLAEINNQISMQSTPNVGMPMPTGAENYDQMISNMAKGMSGQPQTGTDQQTGSQPQSGARATTGGIGGLGNLGDLDRMLVTGGLAGALAKLAYDETKKDKGVPLTPLTQMDATGRYNIEAEVARRMGQQAPNPVEFGLLPANTFPQLSGGKPMQARDGGSATKQYPNKGLEALAKVAPQVVDRMGYYGGGMVMPMAYAEGGNVNMEDFNRMNGGINGEGTETSDDIPAMLSDGEFVMTGQAVRGAGRYQMEQGNGGIISLVPTLDEDRQRGTDLMYKMMDTFANQAQPSQELA